MIKVLVAYATRHGSTTDIAEKIGDTLQSNGLQADVLSIADISTLAGYQAIILGSAVYAGQWEKEAVNFLTRNEHSLAEVPTWFFSSGPTGEGDALELVRGWRFPEPLLPIADRIHPRDMMVFHGDIESDRLSFGEKLIIKGVRAKIGDFRDWEEIKKWTTGVAEAILKEVQPHQTT